MPRLMQRGSFLVVRVPGHSRLYDFTRYAPALIRLAALEYQRGHAVHRYSHANAGSRPVIKPSEVTIVTSKPRMIRIAHRSWLLPRRMQRGDDRLAFVADDVSGIVIVPVREALKSIRHVSRPRFRRAG